MHLINPMRRDGREPNQLNKTGVDVNDVEFLVSADESWRERVVDVNLSFDY